MILSGVTKWSKHFRFDVELRSITLTQNDLHQMTVIAFRKLIYLSFWTGAFGLSQSVKFMLVVMMQWRKPSNCECESQEAGTDKDEGLSA